jgi:hypothetical protein
VVAPVNTLVNEPDWTIGVTIAFVSAIVGLATVADHTTPISVINEPPFVVTEPIRVFVVVTAVNDVVVTVGTLIGTTAEEGCENCDVPYLLVALTLKV